MGNWYERNIVPHIIRLGCGCPAVMEKRAAIVPLASGRVLEMGVGSGLNLRFYDPARVERVIGIDPSPELRAMAAKAEYAPGLAVEIGDGVGEALPFADGSFDTVVATYTLCSVADPLAMLREARRVLRPGGAYLFSEHGRAPAPGIARWQERIDPLWKRLFGGCHLSRPISGTIARCFRIETVEGGYMAGTPKLVGWTELGRAIAA